MNKNKKEKITKFIIVTGEPEPDKIKIEIEWDNTEHCAICDELGSYWVGGNYSICLACIKGLAKIIKNLK